LFLKNTSPLINLALEQGQIGSEEELVHILVPDVTIRTVLKSLELIYTGQVDLESDSEMENVMEFTCEQLGIDMMLVNIFFFVVNFTNVCSSEFMLVFGP
jgi:hypothetical protein